MLARGAGGVATWALERVVDTIATDVFVDPAEAMMMIARAGDAAYRSSAEPSAQAVHEHAQQRRSGPTGNEFSGLNVDYIMHTVLDACRNLDAVETTGGGALIAAGAPEWFVSYNIELGTEGERIAELWFDPRR